MRLIVLFSLGGECRFVAMTTTSLLYSSRTTWLLFAMRVQLRCGKSVISFGGKWKITNLKVVFPPWAGEPAARIPSACAATYNRNYAADTGRIIERTISLRRFHERLA
jgi:hypothetical protein